MFDKIKDYTTQTSDLVQEDSKKADFGALKWAIVAVIIVVASGSVVLGWYYLKNQKGVEPSAVVESAVSPDLITPDGSTVSSSGGPNPQPDTPSQPGASSGQNTAAVSPVSTSASGQEATVPETQKTSEATGQSSSVSSDQGGKQDTNQPVVSAKTINTSALALDEKKSGYCRAIAPDDWAITSGDDGQSTDLRAPRQGAHAGWWISYVMGSTMSNLRDINDYIGLAMANFVGYSGFRFTSSETGLGEGFLKRDFESEGKKGLVFWKKYDVGNGDYIASTYFAAADSSEWNGSAGASAQFAAISIRCVAQLRPGTSGSNPSSSSGNPEMSLSDKWTEAIMGYENVYSPTTGEHWEAPLNSFWDTGPDGPGYYREIPNGYEKLERGFGDY